jgi:ACS family glucarate transporter-like MFS transporter
MNPFRNHVRWFLIFWMFVISAIAYLDRVNISIAGTSMEREYGFDHVKLGLVLSAFAWGYALFQAPAGRLADRFGPRRILAFGVVWWAVFTALTAAVPTGFRSAIFVLIAIRFLLGTGEAVVYPAANRLVASWIPSRERGLANGFIFAGVGAGAGLAPPLITYILLHQGWRWSFWISAGMGLVAGLIWFGLARDTPEQHSWVTPEEAETIRSGLPAFAETQQPLAWGAILSSRDVAAVTFSYFCYGYVAYIFFAWFYIYLSAVRGLDLKSSAYYSMLPFLAMAVGSPLGGWISDFTTRRVNKRVGRCWVAGASMALCTIFIATSTYARDTRLASIILAGGAGALYLSQSSFWSVTSEMAGTSAGSVSGLMNMGGQVGAAVTAYFTPLIAKHFGWGTSFLMAAMLCALGALAWLAVDSDRGSARLHGILRNSSTEGPAALHHQGYSIRSYKQ